MYACEYIYKWKHDAFLCYDYVCESKQEMSGLIYDAIMEIEASITSLHFTTIFFLSE